MGDVAMISPIVRALSEQHHSIQITVISRPFFEPFFNQIPNVTFFAIDVKKRHKGFFGLIRLFFDLKKLNIDAFADLHNVLRSKIIRTLFALSGKKVAFTDKGRKEKKALTRSKNKVFQPVKTMFERHIETFEQLGFSVNLDQPEFPNLALSEKTQTISGEKNNQKWIGIAPFAQYQSKVYPIDLMQQVIDILAKNSNYQIFLFGGGKHETEILNSFSTNKKNCIVVAGKLDLLHELQLISQLDVMVSMDSGNGHIAAMLGKKVITLWGATHPFAGFAPFNQPMELSLTADRQKYPLLPTSVYGNKIVEGYQDVMRSISVESVVNKINSVINQ
jgi:ADP-heptose:LPS heptosyltransferase